MSLEIVDALHMEEGDGVEVRRLFPFRGGRMNFDPFVLWDHFRLEPGSGFPTHPHRGFEAITYLFSGSIEHRDNLGNRSVVTAGGAQRFTAGSGIRHSEMPATDGTSSGIQLWINLPQRLKQIDAAYQQADADTIPQQTRGDATARVIVGPGGPVKLRSEVRYHEARLRSGGHYHETVPSGFQGFVYIVEGELQFEGRSIETGQALLFSDEASIDLSAASESHFMVAMGRPHGEPIRQWGPYVD